MALADLRPGEHAEHVRNHWWWRPGWRPGRRFYALHVTSEVGDDLRRLASTYRHALEGLPSLTLVPDRWLHLTVHGLGFVDEIPHDAVAQVMARARALLLDLPPFTLTFRDAVVADEAIALPAEPPEPVRRLRSTVRRAIGGVLGEQRVGDDPDRFRPHVSVAYVERAGPAAPYIEAVGDLQPASAQVKVRNVDLIEMHRDQQMYEWRTLHRLSIGKAGRTNTV